MKKFKMGIQWVLFTLLCMAGINQAAAQGTAFTYQGRLNSGTNPATGTYDLTFSLYTAITGGTQTGSMVTNLSVGVTNGLFTVTEDFGAIFTGTPYWLQIGVRTNGTSTFTPLTPRQLLTPTPYAIYAESAGSTPLLGNSANQNFFAGQSAGNASVTGVANVGLGGSSLISLTSGIGNSASGFDTLFANTTGSFNTAQGEFALGDNTTGSGNTAIGRGAMVANITGSNNVAMGSGAMQNSLTDSGLVAIGYQALQNDAVVGSFVGSGANTAVGYQALQADVGGSANTAIGFQALNKTTNGYNDTASGWWALLQNTTGYNNTADGALALAGNTTGVNNTADGAFALEANTTGSYNTANGSSALGGNTTGGNNVAVGFAALSANVSTSGNVAIGYQALYANTMSEETAVGSEVLEVNTTGYQNTGVGYRALFGNIGGSQNTATGVGALEANVSGQYNTAIGALALNKSTNATDNTAVGYEALPVNITGNGNVGLGVSTLNANTAGNGNTALGSAALFAVTGNNNIGIGNGGGDGLTTGNNNIDIGNVGNAGDNGVIRIGTPGTQTGTYISGPLLVDGSDTNNGLSYAASGLPGISFGSGPFLFGFDGGALGAVSPTTICLSWDYTGDVWVSNNLSTATLTIRGGSDLAEPFQINSSDSEVPQGAVVVIDEANPGQLKMTDRPYDTRVAGVVSGANGVNPGIQMHQEGLLDGGKNVALTGRVYVRADTSNGSIHPGDLLTTSRTPGVAMKVTSHAKAQGAVLGKAMTGLKNGSGMVLVLVTLQ